MISCHRVRLDQIKLKINLGFRDRPDTSTLWSQCLDLLQPSKQISNSNVQPSNHCMTTSRDGPRATADQCNCSKYSKEHTYAPHAMIFDNRGKCSSSCFILLKLCGHMCFLWLACEKGLVNQLNIGSALQEIHDNNACYCVSCLDAVLCTAPVGHRWMSWSGALRKLRKQALLK